MSSSKHEKQPSINVQSEEKAKAQEAYAKMEKLMKKIRNEYKYDKVCNFKSIERTFFLELDRSKRDCTTIQLLDSSSVRNEEDAKKSFDQIMNCLYKNKLVQETIKYKRERMLQTQSKLDVMRLLEELLCVNLPLLPETILRLKNLLIHKGCVVLF